MKNKPLYKELLWLNTNEILKNTVTKTPKLSQQHFPNNQIVEMKQNKWYFDRK